MKIKRESLNDSESAVATVIAAVMLLAIIVTIFAIVRISYIPEWRDDAEASHMKDVLEDMGNLRSTIDTAAFFKSSSVPSQSTTVQIRMGGGEVPILDTTRTSGTLSVNMDPCSAYLILNDSSGKNIYSDSFDCGGITYDSNNEHYVDQTLRYENGALILAQSDRSVMRQAPPFTINSTKIDPGNDSYNFSVSMNLINVSGKTDSISSDTIESLRLSATNFEQLRDDDSEQVDTFSYTIFTKYPVAWASYFNDTAKDAGLIYGSDYSITKSLSDNSKGLYSVSFNFLHTSDKYLDNIYVNTSRVDVNRGNVVRANANNITSLRQPPTPGFSFIPSTGSAPLSIQITDESKGATSYSYNFGDSTAAVTEAAPTHTYTTPGIFTIIQTVKNKHGNNTATKQIKIRHMPIANFTCDVILGEVPLTVTFTNHSQYAPDGITWDFGDGSPTETNSTVTHTYEDLGTYTVTLTASNGFETNTKTCVIKAVEMPTAGFSADPITGNAPLTVTFLDLSRNTNIWNWNFGDGSVSTEQNPTYTYSTVGNYEATLTAINEYGQDIMTVPITVSQPKPVASFTPLNSTGKNPFTVTFTDTSTNSPTSWYWTFGEKGATSTLQNPTYRFTTKGTFSVTLRASNAGGYSMAYTTVTVT